MTQFPHLHGPHHPRCVYLYANAENSDGRTSGYLAVPGYQEGPHQRCWHQVKWYGFKMWTCVKRFKNFFKISGRIPHSWGLKSLVSSKLLFELTEPGRDHSFSGEEWSLAPDMVDTLGQCMGQQLSWVVRSSVFTTVWQKTKMTLDNKRPPGQTLYSVTWILHTVWCTSNFRLSFMGTPSKYKQLGSWKLKQNKPRFESWKWMQFQDCP